jgi:hypothetical protein
VVRAAVLGEQPFPDGAKRGFHHRAQIGCVELVAPTLRAVGGRVRETAQVEFSTLEAHPVGVVVHGLHRVE